MKVEKCYNKKLNAYRFLKWKKGGTEKKQKHYVGIGPYHAIERGTMDSSTHYYSLYPYKFYFFYKTIWDIKEGIVLFGRWLKKDDYTHFKWFLTTITFLTVNIIGWIVTVYFKCK